VTHSGIAEISKPIRGLVSFLEDNSKLCFEFSVRPTASCRAVVHANAVGGAPQLIGRFLRFLGLG